MTDPTFVIAGSYREYSIFLEDRGLSKQTTDYIFISDPLRLHGMQNISILCIGQYWKSPVFAVRDHVEDRNITFVTESGKVAL